MRIIVLALAFAFSYFRSVAQTAPDIDWQVSLGGSEADFSNALIETSDGGMAIVAVTKSVDGDVTGNNGAFDLWIIKLNSSGELEWQKALGGSKGDGGSAIEQASDGSFLIAGYTSSVDSDVTFNHGNYDFWLVKLDQNGNLISQKCFGGIDEERASCIQLTPDGGCIMGGYSFSNDGDVTGNHGAADYWILKLDSNMNIQWEKSYGGTENDFGQSIDVLSDGSYIVVGYTDSQDGEVSDSHGNREVWVIKIASDGSMIWQKCLGGSGNDSAQDIHQTSDGGFVLTGHSDSNDGDVSGNHDSDDYWVAKLFADGEIDWERCYGGSTDDCCLAILETPDGGYALAGHSYSSDGDKTCHIGGADIWVVQSDSEGEIVWQKCLGGTGGMMGGGDFPFDIIQMEGGGFIVAGKSDSDDGDVTVNHGEDDVWIVRLKSAVATSNVGAGLSKTTFHIDPSLSSNGAFNYSFPEEIKNGRIDIINMLGQKVQEIYDVNGVEGAATVSIPVGLYQVLVFDGDILKYSAPIVIQH